MLNQPKTNLFYSVKHWLATLLLAPFLPTMYEFFFYPVRGQVFSLLEIYPLTLLFSLFFSAPTFIVHYLILFFLNKKQITTLAVTKAILINWTILGIVITFIIIGGRFVIIYFIAYSLAAIITGLLLRLKSK